MISLRNIWLEIYNILHTAWLQVDDSWIFAYILCFVSVHEDSEDSNASLKCVNFVSTTYENYSDWIVSLTIPEPKDDKFIPMYPKQKVYAEISTEYSLEELRSLRYLCNEKKPVIPISETNKAVQSIVEDTQNTVS